MKGHYFCAAGAILAAGLIGVPASAAEVQLQPTVALTAPDHVGALAQVNDFRLGMTPDQVQALILQKYKMKGGRGYRSLKLIKQGFDVYTKHGTLAGMDARYIKTAQNMFVDQTFQISTPASGGVVIGTDYSIDFHQATTQPTVKDLMADLIAKYGPPSGTLDQNDSLRLNWVLDPTWKHKTCKVVNIDYGPRPKGACSKVVDGEFEGDLEDYQARAKIGDAFSVQAVIKKENPYEGKPATVAYSLEVIIDDNADKIRDLEEMNKQFVAAAPPPPAPDKMF